MEVLSYRFLVLLTVTTFVMAILSPFIALYTWNPWWLLFIVWSIIWFKALTNDR